MTREQKIAALKGKIENNNILLFVLKRIIGNSLDNIEDETILDNWIGVIGAYEATSVVFAIDSARTFGNRLTAEFAIENVQAGITQAGKSKVVADYLQDLERYLKNGSLYVAIEEIDSKIGNVPPELSPYVDDARLQDYKLRIQTYLGIAP